VQTLRQHREAAFARGHAKATDYVFASETGGPSHYRNVVRRRLDKALADAGLAKGAVAFAVTAFSSETAGMRSRRPCAALVPRSAFAGFRFPPDVIVVAARWYLRFGLSLPRRRGIAR
jgi:hypothetical protein